MKLIEQLGGYCKARKSLDLPRYSWYDELVEELLQYRRENGIFEVGDKVVFLSNIAPEHEDIYLVKECFSDSCFVVEGGMDYRAFYEYIRHVTDEEIKIGRRL